MDTLRTACTLICAALAPYATATAQEVRAGGIDGALSPEAATPGQDTAAGASDLLFQGSAVGAPVFYGVSALVGPSRDWRPVAHTASAEGVALGVTLGAKELFYRRRPYTWYPDATASGAGDWCSDASRSVRAQSGTAGDCHSFWSGHTAVTGAATFSTAMSLQLTRELTPLESLLLFGAATALTSTTGALRVASGRHYASDVAVGGAVGVGVGVGVPLLWHAVAPRRPGS